MLKEKQMVELKHWTNSAREMELHERDTGEKGKHDLTHTTKPLTGLVLVGKSEWAK